MPRHEEALAVWWVLLLGFAFGLLPRARPPRVVAIPVVAILLLALWTAISLSWTESDERTFAELTRFLHYAGILILIWSVVTRDTWRAAAGGILAAAIAVSALALASRLDPGPFPTNYIGVNFQINRLSYPFNYWNAVGAWTVMSMAMSLAWSAHTRRLAVRCVCVAAIPVAGTAAYLTYSRAAVIGTVLGVIFVIALSRNRWVALVHALAAAAGVALTVSVVRQHRQIVEATGNHGAWSVLLALVGAIAIAVAAAVVTHVLRGDQRWHLPKRVGRIAAVTGVLIVAIGVPAVAHGKISNGWHEFRHEPNIPDTADPAKRLSHLNGYRYLIWRSAWDAFKAEPIKGVGSGTFEFWWSRHGGSEYLRDAHSIYLEEFGEQGLPGGILTLVLLGGLLAGALMARRGASELDIGPHVGLVAAFGAFLVHAGVDWMWESTAVAVLGITVAAVATSARSQPLARARLLRVRVPLVALALVAGLLQLPVLVSTSSMRKSQREFDKGNTQAALASANDAIQTEPWAASPYVQRALVEESADQLEAARLDLQRARRREPTNWRQPLLLARIDAERGDAKAALADYALAKRLRPKGVYVNPQFP